MQLGSKKNLIIALSLTVVVGLFAFWVLYFRNTNFYTSFFESNASNSSSCANGDTLTGDEVAQAHDDGLLYFNMVIEPKDGWYSGGDGAGGRRRDGWVTGFSVDNYTSCKVVVAYDLYKAITWPNQYLVFNKFETIPANSTGVTLMFPASVMPNCNYQPDISHRGAGGENDMLLNGVHVYSPSGFCSAPTPTPTPTPTEVPPEIGIKVQKNSDVTASCVDPQTSVQYTYRVTNTSSRGQLKNITITDDKCTNIVGPTGDTGNDQTLPLSEAWEYTCTTNLEQTTTNTVTVTGDFNDNANQRVTDTDALTVSLCESTPTPTPTATPSETPIFTATPTFTPPPFLSLSIEKLGENISQENPQLTNRVDGVPGDLIRFTLRVTSDANIRLTNVVVRDVLPPELIYEPGTTRVNNVVYPDGIIGNGIIIPTLDPGQRMDVTFRARAKSGEFFPTGTSVLVNAGYARADGISERESKIPIYITKNILVPIGDVETGVDGATLTLISSLLLTFGYHFGRSGLGMLKGTLQSHHLIPGARMLTVMAALLLLLGGSISISTMLKKSEVTAIEIRNPIVHTQNDSYFGLIGR